MVLIVKCPGCGKNQKTNPRITRPSDLTKKTKRCVYCGRSFKIHSNNNSRIVGSAKK